MNGSGFHGDNIYRLVLNEDGAGEARRIEFEARGVEAALLLAGRHCGGRVAEIFENGRSLGSVQNVPRGGYWVITAAAAAGDGKAR